MSKHGAIPGLVLVRKGLGRFESHPRRLKGRLCTNDFSCLPLECTRLASVTGHRLQPYNGAHAEIRGRFNDNLDSLGCGVSFWAASGSMLILMLAGGSDAPRLVAPEAVARTETAIPSETGYGEQKCVPSWVYRPDPQVVSTSVAGLRKARHLQDAEKVLAGSKPHGKFFLDLFCSDAAFTSVIAAGSVSTGFEQSAAVLGSWSQDLCGAMQVVVVARTKEHVVAVSFDLKHVLSAKYRCDDRSFATAQDCVARDECLKVLFADSAWQERFKQDLRKAFDVLIFKP